MRKLFPVIFFSALLCAGCRHYAVHPGAANAFDSRAYDSLLTARAAIDATKAEIASSQIPSAAIPYANRAIDSYDIARAAYIAYHDAALNGGSTSALESALTADLANLSAAIAAVETKQGVTP